MGQHESESWMGTLEEMQRAIQGCLSVLDRYEARFTELLDATSPQEPSRPEDPLPPLRNWEEPLLASQAVADEVERLIAEQQALWDRWRESLAAWCQLVEQPAGSGTSVSG